MEIQLFLILLPNYLLITSCFLSCSSANAILLDVASPPSIAKPNCPTHCGSIEIPYPFGIGPGCYHNNTNDIDYGFEILCDNSTNPPKPFLNLNNTSPPEVLDISLSGTIRINNPIFFSDCPNKTNHPHLPSLEVTPFYLSDKNKFTSVSCGRIASLQTFPYGVEIAVCLSICDYVVPVMANNTCDGINCCQTSVRFAKDDVLDTSFGPLINNSGDVSERSCKYAFLVDPEWFATNSTNTSAIADMDYVPILLDWGIYNNDVLGGQDKSIEDNKKRKCDSTSGRCSCTKGYQGNPYLRGGCQDINECADPHRPNICGWGSCSNTEGYYLCHFEFIGRRLQPIRVVIIVLCSISGVALLIIGIWWLHNVIKQRRYKTKKEKFYAQNGGLLLEKMSSSGEVNVEKIKLFNDKELEKATDRFSIDRILGKGGQGTVYKGMLADGKIVAIKKSKIIGQGDVSRFINEIVILSQINHRNVVKILGCCLESEVPLLVYEFLPKGTLSEFIHNHDDCFPLTWEMRLRVGIEIAAALSYLHSFASMPIYHRDIKSSNILLDEKHRAKVADFGMSRSVSIDQTHLTMTHVNGTFGYLDPEYFQSSQFTDKSDVYSFGVVLAELLTGLKPVSITRSSDVRQDGRSLVTYFKDSMEEDSLFDILDAEVMKGGTEEEIMVVAKLTKRCLNMKGKKRPTMKEVAAELEEVLIRSRSSDVEHNREVDYQETDIVEAWDFGCALTWSPTNSSSSLDGQPLMTFKSL